MWYFIAFIGGMLVIPAYVKVSLWYDNRLRTRLKNPVGNKLAGRDIP